jgi:RimJ/RimL family protein N-acetyltransferase
MRMANFNLAMCLAQRIGIKVIATEALSALNGLLKTQPGVHRIQSFVDAENVSSARVLIKSGLVEEARNL